MSSKITLSISSYQETADFHLENEQVDFTIYVCVYTEIVQTLIKLLLREQTDQGLYYVSTTNLTDGSHVLGLEGMCRLTEQSDQGKQKLPMPIILNKFLYYSRYTHYATCL